MAKHPLHSEGIRSSHDHLDCEGVTEGVCRKPDSSEVHHLAQMLEDILNGVGC